MLILEDIFLPEMSLSLYLERERERSSEDLKGCHMLEE